MRLAERESSAAPSSRSPLPPPRRRSPVAATKSVAALDPPRRRPWTRLRQVPAQSRRILPFSVVAGPAPSSASSTATRGHLARASPPPAACNARGEPSSSRSPWWLLPLPRASLQPASKSRAPMISLHLAPLLMACNKPPPPPFPVVPSLEFTPKAAATSPSAMPLPSCTVVRCTPRLTRGFCQVPLRPVCDYADSPSTPPARPTPEQAHRLCGFRQVPRRPALSTTTFAMYIYTKTGPTSTPTTCVPLPSTPWTSSSSTKRVPLRPSSTIRCATTVIVYHYFHYRRTRSAPKMHASKTHQVNSDTHQAQELTTKTSLLCSKDWKMYSNLHRFTWN